MEVELADIPGQNNEEIFYNPICRKFVPLNEGAYKTKLIFICVFFEFPLQKIYYVSDYSFNVKCHDLWHGKVPNIHFSCRGMLDIVEDCGMDAKTH